MVDDSSGRLTPTLHQVAERAGVARGTVSNVLNHPGRVSPELTERVRAAMLELGFVRNESARQLRSGRSSSLALSLIDTWNPYFNDVARGIEDAVYGQGWTLSASTSAFDRDRERVNLAMFEERRVAGVIAVPIDEESIEQLAAMRRRGLACVLVDRDPEGLPVPAHSVDEEHGGRLAGAHLVSLGRRRIAFCGNLGIHRHAGRRLAGLRAGAGDAAEIEHIAVDGLTVSAGIKAGEQIARRPASDRPDAIFAVNDLVAIGLLQSLSRAGIAVPTEISLVGFDDIEFASQVAVPLTTVRQPSSELGRLAAELLLAEITDGISDDPPHIVHTPTLVVRESTAPV